MVHRVCITGRICRHLRPSRWPQSKAGISCLFDYFGSTTHSMMQQRASSCVTESSLTARLCFYTVTVSSLNSPHRKEIGPQFICPKIVPKRKRIWNLWGPLTCLRWVDKNLRGGFGFGNPRILQDQRFHEHPAKRHFNMCFIPWVFIFTQVMLCLFLYPLIPSSSPAP